ncbi:Gfo/Idh/MocA family oxidoreductase [Actinotalea sp. BY-33]|uniref:Gfo/Idh/MocA family oxidoreductase n=1 Tax=Actinotalea soli TaxID=2819234 RepID=A0A939LNA3_9CELL|nr:Gfo/Idh/MocA family oxidoreductase [Actinotalea soli]MBO1751497.1 Gfo/Idh/MocA family oxidoreductase [Actinotalea soli]
MSDDATPDATSERAAALGLTSPAAEEGAAGPVRFAVVGSGWRAEFFLRMAVLMPERFAVVGVVSRTAERGAEVTARWGTPTFRTVGELLAATDPELVVVSVPWDVTPVVTRELVEAGTPVLAETPPAPDAAGLRTLWEQVGASGLVQVAEHSPVMPAHAARHRLLQDGAIGQVTSVQISSTHMYHAVAVIRRLLGAGFEPVRITAQRFAAPLMNPRTRAGWTGDRDPVEASTILALLDLGEGRSAVYDFTDNQWHNPLRADRLLVRGSHGELLDDRVTRWLDGETTIDSPLVRSQSGIGQDLDGYDLQHLSFEGQVVYRNPFVGARLSDDDIAVATLLDRTGAWVRGQGEPPYPLAEGSQDHLISLAVEEAAGTGQPITTEREAWAG